MKFKVTMKDPDTLHDAIVDAVRIELLPVKNLTDQERKYVSEMRVIAATEIASTWFNYGEYLTIEIDTEANTAVVCNANDID